MSNELNPSVLRTAPLDRGAKFIFFNKLKNEFCFIPTLSREGVGEEFCVEVRFWITPFLTKNFWKLAREDSLRLREASERPLLFR